MTDSQHNEPDIEDRGANIRLTVENIINVSYEAMFERFDKLKKRGINDDDMVAALRHLEHEEILDAYAEWADIDIREDDNTTLNPAVPDPGDAPSYNALGEVIRGLGRSTQTFTPDVDQKLVKDQLDEAGVVVRNGKLAVVWP